MSFPTNSPENHLKIVMPGRRRTEKLWGARILVRLENPPLVALHPHAGDHVAAAGRRADSPFLHFSICPLAQANGS